MQIELVTDHVRHLTGWETEDLPREHSIRKIFGTTIYLNNSEMTENLIGNIFGLRLDAEEGNMKRYISGSGDSEAKIDIIIDPAGRPGMQSAGSIHHIAWRTESDEAQLAWSKKLRAHGYLTTEVKDRNYFHSIYFREPGGVLFEIATDEPGFMIDESPDSLGEELKLPPQYESRREKIEHNLIPIRQTKTMVMA
jgi:glyoxalase family protein